MNTQQKSDVMLWLNADPMLSAAEAQWYADVARRAEEEEKKALESKKEARQVATVPSHRVNPEECTV